MRDEKTAQILPDTGIVPGILIDRTFPVRVTVPVFPVGTGGKRFP
jgi:hypothetical protein